MAEPPKTKSSLATAEELNERHKRHTFQKKLAGCRKESTVEKQHPWLDSQRKKELVRHIDPNTNEEVLVEAVYTDNPPGTAVQRIILRLCDDDGTHNLRLL